MKCSFCRSMWELSICQFLKRKQSTYIFEMYFVHPRWKFVCDSALCTKIRDEIYDIRLDMNTQSPVYSRAPYYAYHGGDVTMAVWVTPEVRMKCKTFVSLSGGDMNRYYIFLVRYQLLALDKLWFIMFFGLCKIRCKIRNKIMLLEIDSSDDANKTFRYATKECTHLSCSHQRFDCMFF